MPQSDPNELLKCRLNETGEEVIYRRVIAEKFAARGFCAILGTTGEDPRPDPWEAVPREDLMRRADTHGIAVTPRTSSKALWEAIERAETEAADAVESARASRYGPEGEPAPGDSPDALE